LMRGVRCRQIGRLVSLCSTTTRSRSCHEILGAFSGTWVLHCSVLYPKSYFRLVGPRARGDSQGYARKHLSRQLYRDHPKARTGTPAS
jgi:hypothetical protein